MKKRVMWIVPLLLLVFMMPQSAFADKGDFYNKYKDKFDDAPLPEEYIDVIKVFDSETNSFDCGTFDVYCKSASISLSWSTGLANFVSGGLTLLVLDPGMITKDATFIRYRDYFQELSTGMLVLFMVYQIMMIVIRRYGDSDDYGQALNQKILLVFSSAMFLALYESIFTFILSIQNEVTSAILKTGFTRDDLLLMMLIYSPQYSIFFALFIGIIFIIFLIALLYRFVSLGFFYAVGPVAIPTMLNDEFNYFQIWLKYIVNNIVTLILQSIAFVMSIAAMTGQFSFSKNLSYGVDIIAGFLLTIVLCFFALVIPGILGGLGSSTGTGRAVGRIARFAVTKR